MDDVSRSQIIFMCRNSDLRNSCDGTLRAVGSVRSCRPSTHPACNDVACTLQLPPCQSVSVKLPSRVYPHPLSAADPVPAAIISCSTRHMWLGP